MKITLLLSSIVCWIFEKTQTLNTKPFFELLKDYYFFFFNFLSLIEINLIDTHIKPNIVQSNPVGAVGVIAPPVGCILV